jgi:hypothetical protein
MKKALRGELNLRGLNMYDLTDCILQYFFEEMHNMGRSELQELYSIFAEGSLNLKEYYKVTPEGNIAPYPLCPTEFSFVPYSYQNAKRILCCCNQTFKFQQIPENLLTLLFVLANEPVSFDDSCISIVSQGMYFVLSMLSVHQSGDPFLGYIIRAMHHSHDPLDAPFYEFHLEKLLHVSLINGSYPKIVKLWKSLYPGRWSQPAFLSIFVDTRLSQMFKMFYAIVNTPDYFVEIDGFISENSSANLQSLRLFLSKMEQTGLVLHLTRRFRPFLDGYCKWINHLQ